MDVKDHGDSLGELYRMATPEGSIKWVCADHRAAFEEPSTKVLQDMVEECKGVFIDHLSKISIKIGSQTTATQFYRAMDNVRGLQELEVTLEWDATMTDLQTLAEAVTKAGLISFTIDGSHFKNPRWDAFNSGRRYNPIIELGSNGCLQHLGLIGFKSFFSRFSRPSGSFSKLRMLSVELKMGLFDVVGPFMQSLDYFPLLISLVMKMGPSLMLVHYGTSILDRVPKLESLEFCQWWYSFTARISERKVEDMIMIFKSFRAQMDLDRMLFNQGHLTHMTVDSYTYPYLLADILLYNPRLHTLRIRDSPYLSHWVVTHVISARTSLLQDQGFCQLRMLELFSSEASSIRFRLSFVKDSASYDMASWIQLRDAQSQQNESRMCDFVEDFGWSVVSLEAWMFSDRLAAALDARISQRGSQLETLAVAAAGRLGLPNKTELA
ncbi:hypothetical protein BGX31_002452 [Mortierella sp. GBA43]|nr:hypothetical protein BGX31_002452 [Mortierella sp. GBA43]